MLKEFKLTVKHVRERLYKMIDHRLHVLSEHEKKERREVLIWN